MNARLFASLQFIRVIRFLQCKQTLGGVLLLGGRISTPPGISSLLSFTHSSLFHQSPSTRCSATLLSSSKAINDASEMPSTPRVARAPFQRRCSSTAPTASFLEPVTPLQAPPRGCHTWSSRIRACRHDDMVAVRLERLTESKEQERT